MKEGKFLASLAILGAGAVLPVMAGRDTDAVSDSVVVDARPQVVWSALRQHRQANPKRRLLTYNGNEAIVEEKFDSLPVIGSADCVYREVEKPPTRIDYQLIKSDKLTSFEGSWLLTPERNGKSTILKLSSRTDTALRVPFGRSITRQATSKSVRCRLTAVKELAEAM